MTGLVLNVRGPGRASRTWQSQWPALHLARQVRWGASPAHIIEYLEVERSSGRAERLIYLRAFSRRSVQRYQNLHGNSGVSSFECGPEFIKVRFHGGVTYVYDYRRPGRDHVERMKELARAGSGLSTYISQRVAASYARKEP